MIGHPSVTLFPAVAALTESLELSGREALTAYLCGFEVEASLGRSFNPSHYAAGWHSTGTIGTLSAAAASSKLLHLSYEEILAALGIAASLCSGLKQNFGKMTKPFHAGK